MTAPRSEDINGVGTRLKWLRRNGPLAQFGTIKGMCEHLGIGKSTWYDWTSESYPPEGYILEWLRDRGVNLSWFKTGMGEPFTGEFTPPLDIDGGNISEPQAATDESAQQNAGLLVEHRTPRKGRDIPYVHWVITEVGGAVPEATGYYFGFTDDELRAIRVDTTAMDGACPDALRFGDTVLVRPGGVPEDNETWVVQHMREDATWSDADIRRVVLLGEGRVLLSPNNPLFEEVEKHFQEVSFLGKVEYRIAELHSGEATISREQWVHVDDLGVRQAVVELLDDSRGRQILKDWAKLDYYGQLAVFGMIESLLQR